MPELPEVEIAARNLARWAKGRVVVRAEAERSRVLRPGSPDRVAALLAGARVGRVRRRGKNVLVELRSAAAGRAARAGDLAIRVHLGMTGRVVRRAPGEAVRHSRARLFLDDGRVLHYADPRQFGRFEVGPRPAIEAAAFGSLGVDPLADPFDGDVLRGRIGEWKRPAKLALMDQTRVAGLGNIQAAEALWRAKISPFRPACALGGAEWTRLAKAIVASVRETLAKEKGPEVVYVEEPGAPNPFLVYDRGGEPCPRCRKPIRRTEQGGRSTFWCDRCQR